MENDKYFTCIKCGKTYFRSDLLVHDARCKGRKNNNYNISNTNNIFSNYNNDRFNYYKCIICNAEIKLEEKIDHLLCHELEDNERREDNIQNINYNRNINRNNNPDIHFNRNINNNRYNNQVNFLNNNRNNNRSNNNRRNSMSYIRRNNAYFRGGNTHIFGLDNLSSDESYESYESDKYEGLDHKIIENFPISKIKDINKLDEEKKKCLICLENFKIGENTIILPCIHIFHSNCIKKWMEKNNKCPICKYKIDSFE